MKCGKCGEEVSIQPGKSSNFCSNCGNKIEAEKSGDWKYFDNTKELLAYVAAKYGNDALFGRNYFKDHSSPMMPQGQKNLVKQAFECGAVKILQDNVNSNQANKEIAVKQAVRKMVDTYSSAQEAAERVVWELTNAIGWGMPEPKNGTAPSNSIGSVAPPPPQPQKNPPAQPSAPGVSTLMTRAWQFAEDCDWKEAADYFNKVLDIDPVYATAFLGLLCVDLKVSKEDKLSTVKDPGSLANHKYYKRAGADPAIKSKLDRYVQIIKDRIKSELKATEETLHRKYGILLDRLSAKGNANFPADVVATVKEDLVFVKLGGIDWLVLTVENNKALLISEDILENKMYNEGEGTTWETCTLRQYLNNWFYNKLGAAKVVIAETRNSNPNNPWYGTAGGNATIDKVFLLSLDELVKYFGDSGDLRNKRRKDYSGNSISDGYCVNDNYNNARMANNYTSSWSSWWLRSPGKNSYRAAVVEYGCINVEGFYVYQGRDIGDERVGVRPALWLNL